MDRLTEKTLIKCQGCFESSNCYNHSCNHINEAIQKLAYYEDLEERVYSIFEDITIEMIVGEIESEHNKSIENILSLCKKLKEMNK